MFKNKEIDLEDLKLAMTADRNEKDEKDEDIDKDKEFVNALQKLTESTVKTSNKQIDIIHTYLSKDLSTAILLKKLYEQK